MGTEKRTFDQPDESRPFSKHGRVDICTVGGIDIGQATFEPGWRWSADVRPPTSDATCDLPHTGYLLSGQLAVETDDGRRVTLNAGDLFHIPPGHDAWTLGPDTCIMIDFVGMQRTTT